MSDFTRKIPPLLPICGENEGGIYLGPEDFPIMPRRLCLEYVTKNEEYKIKQ